MKLIKYRLKNSYYFRVAFNTIKISKAFSDIKIIRKVLGETPILFPNGWDKNFRPDIEYIIDFEKIEELIEKIPEEFL